MEAVKGRMIHQIGINKFIRYLKIFFFLVDLLESRKFDPWKKMHSDKPLSFFINITEY